MKTFRVKILHNSKVEWADVQGYEIKEKLCPNLNFFAYKREYANGNIWFVCEEKTGLAVAEGKTKVQAIIKATQAIDKIGNTRLLEIVERRCKEM